MRFFSFLLLAFFLVLSGACKPTGFGGNSAKKGDKSQASADGDHDDGVEDEDEVTPADIPVQVAGMFLCEPLIWTEGSDKATYGCRVNDDKNDKYIVEQKDISFKAFEHQIIPTTKIDFMAQPLFGQWHTIFSVTRELSEIVSIEATYTDKNSGETTIKSTKLPDFPSSSSVPNADEESDTVLIFGGEAGGFHIGDGGICGSSCITDLSYSSLTGERVWMPFTTESADTEIDISLNLCGIDHADAVYLEVYDEKVKLAEFALKIGDKVVSFKGTKLSEAGNYFVTIVSTPTPLNGKDILDDLIVSKIKVVSTDDKKIIHRGDAFAGEL